MPTLITVRTNAGHVVGRCNQHCYNSPDPHRPCVCGGINNGVGLGRAKKNIHRALAHIAHANNADEPLRIKLHSCVSQPHLFPTPSP